MEPESPGPLDPDPEIAALLEFEPVVHRMPRADGWTPERQRGFIAGLAETGCQEQAAHAVGMTARGAYSLRKQIGAEGFKAAWAEAVALHKMRLTRRTRRPCAAGETGAEQLYYDPDAIPFVEVDELLAGILDRYRRKLQQERECRLAGRIVEADYYVRQLTFIEIGLDLAGNAHALYDFFGGNELDVFRTAGTPMSVLLDRLRRDYWREKGEPDRMPPALLGKHDDRRAAAHRGGHYHDPAEDGDYDEWIARTARIEAIQAEAQRLWEEKAAADAAEWAERVKRADEGGPGAASVGDARA